MPNSSIHSMVTLFDILYCFSQFNSVHIFSKLSLNTLWMLISKYCSFHAKSLGITDNAVSHSFILSFTFLILWVIALSRTNCVFYFKMKNEYFLHTSVTHFKHYILTILCIFFSQYKIHFVSTHSICYNFLSIFSPSLALKINKDTSFSPDSRIY